MSHPFAFEPCCPVTVATARKTFSMPPVPDLRLLPGRGPSDCVPGGPLLDGPWAAVFVLPKLSGISDIAISFLVS